MKRFGMLWLIAAVPILLFSLGQRPASAQDVQNFTIDSFTADYYLNRNSAHTSTLKTVETIVAQFPNYDQNHGILRAIPESYQGHTVSLQIDSVTDGGDTPISYTTYGQNGNLVLKIGDANVYVQGKQTYVITYQERNVANILSDHDEFYWNVNGDQWEQPFNDVVARVHIPQNLVGSLQNRQVCYAGSSDGNDVDQCSISKKAENGGKVVDVEAQYLTSMQSLTFALSFNANTFKIGPEVAAAQHAHRLKIAAVAAAVALPPLISFGYLMVRWRKYGREPKGKGVIIPEYQPPKGLNALTSDYILREVLKTKAISALVIELAIRKYITIYETETSKIFGHKTAFSMKLIKDPGDLAPEEQQVVMMFFKSASVGSEVQLWELKNQLATAVKALKTSLGISLLAKGYFRNDPNKAGVRYYTVGIISVIVAFLLLFTHVWFVAVSLGLVGGMFLLFSRYMPARSLQGVEIRDYMLGLREYIKLAEADRLKFLQSPEGAEKIKEAGLDPDDPKFKVKLFESLLPYAMLFGLEKNWAKQFKDVYNTPPSWFNGNYTAFNTGYLISSLNGFSNYSNLAFTAPSSSGSGFSGGGAGGGGGGGGGGGW